MDDWTGDEKQHVPHENRITGATLFLALLVSFAADCCAEPSFTHMRFRQGLSWKMAPSTPLFFAQNGGVEGPNFGVFSGPAFTHLKTAKNLEPHGTLYSHMEKESDSTGRFTKRKFQKKTCTKHRGYESSLLKVFKTFSYPLLFSHYLLPLIMSMLTLTCLIARL